MKRISNFSNFLFEYRSPDHNLHVVMQRGIPLMADPVLDDEGKDLAETQKRIEHSVSNYQEHIENSQEKMREWKNRPGITKGDLNSLEQSEKTRKLAYRILLDAAEFMEKFNSEYDQRKNDLTGRDHTLVAKAIFELMKIYPEDLIREAGTLKRMRKLKYDAEFIQSVIQWTDAIAQRYQMLREVGKVLGKSPVQIQAMRKQAAAMRQRWGS